MRLALASLAGVLAALWVLPTPARAQSPETPETPETAENAEAVDDPEAAEAEPELTAEEVQQARAHFVAGRQHYEAARYQDAIREFELAFQITGHPDVLYNLAQSYDRLERRPEAIEAYQGYLERADETGDRERVERRIRELRLLMEAAEREGEPLGTAEPTPTDPTPPGPSAPPQAEPRFGLLPWIAMGAGGAFAIGAAITGGMALSLHGELGDECGPTGSMCPANRQDDIDRGHTLTTVTTLLTIGAVAGVGAGLTLFFLDQPVREEAATASTRARLELLPGPAAAGATLRLRL